MPVARGDVTIRFKRISFAFTIATNATTRTGHARRSRRRRGSTNCRGFIELGAVDSRGAFVGGIRVVDVRSMVTEAQCEF